jgi:site-specific DNA-methyltransferase (adenine-specific)
VKPYYQDDFCTIYHGDCREIVPQLEPVDLVLTDPPYKHAHIDGGGLARQAKFFKERRLEDLSSFDLSEYSALLLQASPFLIAFHSRDLICDYAEVAKNSNRKYDLHFWHKLNAVPFTANTWKSDVEYIALIWQKKCGWAKYDQQEYSKVFTSNLMVNKVHPCEKPIDLLYKYIKILKAQSILDPFMGSGTTLRAAKDLGRKAIGIEIEEKYCEIAVERLRQEVLAL